MPDSVVVALLTVAAAGVGYVLRPLGDLINDRRLTAREREAQREKFQIENIIALQEAMGACVLAVFNAAGSSLRQTTASAESAHLLVGSLAARVRDEEVRRLVAAFRTSAQPTAQLGLPWHEQQDLIRKSFDAANDRISAVLRGM
jgi:hypothetical protein